AGVDGSADRAGRAEGETGELETNRRVQRARADEFHRILVRAPLVEEFEPVADGPDRRNDVVTHAAAQKRREVRPAEGQIRILVHAQLLGPVDYYGCGVGATLGPRGE